MPQSRRAHSLSGPSLWNCKGEQTRNSYASANEPDARVSDESDGDGAEQEDENPHSRAEKCVCDFDVVVDSVFCIYADCYHRDEAS
jgi:hypothetical protein